MKKIKIGIIDYGLYNGGAERVALDFAQGAGKYGLNADLILFKNVNEYKEQYKNYSQKIRIIHLLEEQKKIPAHLIFLKKCELFLRMIYFFYTANYEVLVGQVHYHPFYVAVFFAKIFRKKSIVRVGDNMDADFKTKGFVTRAFHSILLRMSLFFSDRIICTYYRQSC